MIASKHCRAAFLRRLLEPEILSQTEDKDRLCAAKEHNAALQICSKLHILSHWLFIKMSEFRAKIHDLAAGPESEQIGPVRLNQPLTLAPPKRSFQRGMTSRL